MRLILVDPGQTGPNIMGVEEEIVSIEFYKQETRAEVQKARAMIREAVGFWTNKGRA